ncbi:hypothetical protein ABPG77_008777 [Micractinium sp. CCAP 211/92]
MQDVEKELPGLIRALLQSPASKQRKLVERHYTPDCRMTHALVMAENREEIVRIFQFWRFANRRLDVDINEIVLDRSGKKVWVQFVQHVTGYQHYLSPPLFGFSLPMSTLLYLRDGPSGCKLICKQVDYHSFEGILYTTPVLGPLFQHGLRRAVSAWMIGGAQLAARLFPAMDSWLQTLLPDYQGCKAAAARLWWRQAPPVRWRRVPAPYDPSL